MSTDANIVTKRLVLRGLVPADAGALFKYRSLPEVCRFQGWKPQTLAEAETFIRERISKIPGVPDTWYQLGILEKETGELIGDIGLHFAGPENDSVEIGYTLHPEHQGKGYATEAVKAVVGHAFRVLHKRTVTASVDPANENSVALLERVGMKRDASLPKDIRLDAKRENGLVFRIMKEDWIGNDALK
jgi:RimJ/RimL family protein N-acetyltransferase